jgi:hypothetical protein
VPTEDYRRFFHLLASTAEEILEVEEDLQPEFLQYSLL